MNAKTARRVLFGLSAAALIGAAGGYAAFAVGEDVPTAAAPAQSPAMARAIGARWRTERTAALANAYAQALIATGLYDELLTEISERGLFARDPAAATLYRTEAALRQGRYKSAIETADAAAGGLDPYLAFARARAAYALTGDRAAAEADLNAALRGPQQIEAQAWLFRARLALDENDLAAADAAARRAVEAGAARADADDVHLEGALRAADLERAAAMIAASASPKRRGFFGAKVRERRDPSILRLAAIAKLKSGDAPAAVRLIDEAPMAGQERTRLLAALAKWMNGDAAQAYALVAATLATAPDDWIALDLAAAISRDLGRMKEADALLDRLAARRPQLAAFRRLAIDGDLDRARAALTVGEVISRGGAAFALLGTCAGLPEAIAEPSDEAFATAELAHALGAGDALVMREKIRLLTAARSPLALALTGDAYVALGDGDRAVAAFERAAAANDAFFAPVDALARLYADSGRLPAALDLMRSFEARNAGNSAARLALAMLQARLGATGSAARIFTLVPAASLFADETAALLYAGAARAEGGATFAAMMAAAERNAPAVTLGKILLAQGEKEEAAAQFRKALIADPLSREAPALYRAAMRDLGRDEEAASLLTALVARRPEATNAAAALAAVEKGGGTGE